MKFIPQLLRYESETKQHTAVHKIHTQSARLGLRLKWSSRHKIHRASLNSTHMVKPCR